jgi:putative thioredoxin
MPAVDVTDDSFEQAVLDRSDAVPVLIDLWAPWCGPCKTLGPIIEKVVGETDGAVELVKVNVDENPRVSAAFQVQSIPAVFAIRERKIVNHFVGALPEREVRDFVDSLLDQPSEADQLTARGDETSLRAALELDPAHAGAISALAELLVDRGDTEEALALLERIPETADTRRVAAKARLAETGEPAADGTDLGERVQALLQRIPGDDEARQQIVDLIETMSDDNPRRAEYRRALASRLF